MEQNDVVIKQCDEVRVYATESGYVCIKQADPSGDDDRAVLIPPQHADALCRAIRAAAKEAKGEQVA